MDLLNIQERDYCSFNVDTQVYFIPIMEALKQCLQWMVQTHSHSLYSLSLSPHTHLYDEVDNVSSTKHEVAKTMVGRQDYRNLFKFGTNKRDKRYLKLVILCLDFVSLIF